MPVVSLARAFDLRSAIAGGLLMACLVGAVNLAHGLEAAALAALKQGAYTFLIAGLILRLCERLATGMERRGPALAAAIGIPSVLTVSATALVHHLRGTAEPWASVAPTLLIGPPSFTAWALRSRRARERARRPPGGQAGQAGP